MWVLLHEGAQVALEGLNNIVQCNSREPGLCEDDDGASDGAGRVLPQKCRDLCAAAGAPALLTYGLFPCNP
eukprot:COSAG05_NODE_1572_length_4520_cov_2.148157_5_plen_71_part_00